MCREEESKVGKSKVEGQAVDDRCPSCYALMGKCDRCKKPLCKVCLINHGKECLCWMGDGVERPT